ncbi:ANKRD50 [Symbiodinium sp. KB8]|nr:ANKRD50 [Symbiodinium sp. KB8]
MTKEKKERRKEKEKERRKEKRKAKEKVSSPGEEESWSWEETWQNEAWGVQDWGEAWAEQDAEYWLLDSGASVVADFFFLSFTGEERVSVRRDNLRVLILVERMSSMVGAVLTTESVIRARHEIIMWLREFGLVSGSTSVLLSTDSESAVSDLVGTAASEFTFSVRKAGPQQHEAVGAAERAVRKVKEALQTLRSDLNAEGSQAIRVRASIRIERRLEALGDRVQPSSSDEPREVLELPVYEDGLASRLVLDEVCEDAEAPRREDAEVGESQPSLLKRPMPAARISTGEHMDLDLPGEPSAASGVKRRSDVEVVDLERLEGEMQQTSHLKPRRLDELLWGSDLAVPVCLDERLTGPNIHGTGISSIVYESGPQSRSEAELVKLGGKSVLLWKPYGGVDDSTMEELDGSLVFEGMKEELVNLERCRTGRVINVLILMYVDDLLIVSESEAAEMAVREAIGSKLTLKITGTIKPSYAGGGATSFIGRFIRRWPGSSVFEVGIDKEYLQPCFTAYGVQKGSSAVPDISAILDRTGETELSQEAYGLFRRALGKVLWFSQTRQDLKLIIGLISTQQSKPAQATEAALRALLRFLYDDRNVALQLPSEQLNEAFLGCPVEELERKVHVFPHASHAPYRFLARRGITGGALTYAGALVRGVAKTQGVVCLSSCEAELHALQHMEQEAVCFAFLLERVLTSLGNLRGGEHVDISLDSSKFEQDGETPGEQVQIDVISDSEAALAVIHAEIAAGRMDFRWLAGTKNPADLYTKVLGSTEVEVVEFPDNDYPDYESDQSGLQRLFKLLVKQGNQDTEESQAKKSEDERQQEVNEVIQQVFDSSEPTGWLLSHKEGFTDDAQELAKPNSKMFSEVPEAKVAVILELLKAFVRKFRSRLHRQALLMAAVTFCDLFLMEWMKAYQVQDKGSGFLPNTKNGGRFQVLLGCRDLATDWMMENVALVQWGVVATSTIVSALMFVSYDALVFPQITKSPESPFATKMLQVKMLSGEALTSIPVEEVHDVKGLKQHLTQLHGLPPRFRQRVFFHGEILEEDVKLDSSMNLDLVVLTFSDVSEGQAEKLAAAASQGSFSEVESMMQLPQDPDLIGTAEQPPVVIAAAGGHVEVLRLLLEAGADKNLADNDGSTALMMAAAQGHATVLRLLLEAGADKNLADNDGSTALMMAARGGHADVMRLLLEAFADANLANNQGTTALMGRCVNVSYEGRAIQAHPCDCYTFSTIQARAVKNLGSNQGMTALMMAARGGAKALVMAVRGGHVDVLHLLKEADFLKNLADNAGPDKNLADNDGSAALMMAARGGHVDVWRLLLEAFADNNQGTTALIMAARGGLVQVLRLLSEARADKNLGDNQGMTALMMAARGGHVDVLRLLLEAGDQGMTALMMAADGGHVDFMRLLPEFPES